MEGEYEHIVPAEDGRIVIPFLVHTGLAATDFRPVHKVVMQKGEVMIGLDGNGRHENMLYILPVHVIGHEHQYGAQAFSAQGEYVPDGLVQGGGTAFIGQ